METNAGPWISALRNSHDRLAGLVATLDDSQLEQQSYDSEWTIAQVLSHLGSQAEISSLSLEAGLSGGTPPSRDDFPAIWDVWNARTPRQQADESLKVNEAAIARLESLTPDQLRDFRVQMFGNELDAANYVGGRLGEHALHTWDVAVAIDPTATVSPDAVALLIDRLAPLAGRTGKPDGMPRHIHFTTADPTHQFVLETGDKVALEGPDGEDTPPSIELPAEAFVRLIYGRLDPAHTPTIDAREVEIDELRPLFPGF